MGETRGITSKIKSALKARKRARFYPAAHLFAAAMRDLSVLSQYPKYKLNSLATMNGQEFRLNPAPVRPHYSLDSSVLLGVLAATCNGRLSQ